MSDAKIGETVSVTDAAGIETANDRFKQSFTNWFWGSMIAAVVAHFALFAFFPEMNAEDFGIVNEEMEVIPFEPPVELPPPPEQIQRPARPVISNAVINEEITIAETTFDALPEQALPPPPKQVEATTAGGPVFTPWDVPPTLANTDEVARALETEYPQVLRNAGIGGRVVLHFHIDETGKVLQTVLAESSGFDAMDEAAEKVASMMRFTPAQNLDKPVAVWVQQPITFTAR